MENRSGTLRERTREAVREQITESAVGLFLDRGYEATTIGDIAAEVGMSQRSVFRYFATKESIVIAKMEHGMQRLLDALRTRPPQEAPWESLCAVLTSETVIGRSADAESSDRAMLQMVFDTPPLMSMYLLRLHQLQQDVTEVVRKRTLAADQPPPEDDHTHTALAASALGCLVAAQQEVVNPRNSRTLGHLVQLSLNAVGSAAGPRETDTHSPQPARRSTGSKRREAPPDSGGRRGEG